MASLEAKADDSSALEKNVPKCFIRMHFVSRKERRLQAPILLVPPCLHNMGRPWCNVSGCYLQDEFLRLNITRRYRKKDEGRQILTVLWTTWLLKESKSMWNKRMFSETGSRERENIE